MKILMAASEFSPFAKTGGLADMVAALTKELDHLDHEVICVVPYYRSAAESKFNSRSTGLRVTVPIERKQVSGDVLELSIGKKSKIFFIRRDEYFDRSHLYRTADRDYEDNAERFIFFSRAVVHLIHSLRLDPDIIHCHDWQTGLVPVFFRWARSPSFGVAQKLPKLVFTIHNLAYQGMFWAADFPLTSLPSDYFTAEGIEYFGHLNCMKGGILFSDVVTTVSESYAKEILTPEFGFGLDPILRKRRDRLFGILNGVDYGEWNPSSDPHIRMRYDISTIERKQTCKVDLLRRYKLNPRFRGALLGIVARLTEQKGIDLLIRSMDELVKRNVKIIILGSGDRVFENDLRQFASKYSKQTGLHIGFDNVAAHRIEAGSDFFLMPSRYEPCGLNQMYSLKYGTIPIVRATGGLNDTIENFDARRGTGNGFKFAEYSTDALLAKLDEALAVFGNPVQWRRLQRNAMECDFSWRKSALKYVELYQRPL